MFVQCPRCALAFGAAAPGASCPRCGAASVAPALPPTAYTPAHLPPTQVSTAASAFIPPTQPAQPPVAMTQPMQPPVAMTQAMQPPVAMTQFAPPPFGAWSPSARGPTDDRGAIAGRAVVAAALSSLAVVGCCNPVGWVGVFAALRAYANTGDADLGPAAARADAALRLGWFAFGSTAALWGLGVAAWWFNP